MLRDDAYPAYASAARGVDHSRYVGELQLRHAFDEKHAARPRREHQPEFLSKRLEFHRL